MNQKAIKKNIGWRVHRSQKSLWSTKNAQNKWLDYYYINSQIIRLLFNDCNAVIVYFIFWFVSPNILNTWHICGTTALSFSSVCALWVGLTAHMYKKIAAHNSWHMACLIPAVELIQEQITFSLKPHPHVYRYFENVAFIASNSLFENIATHQDKNVKMLTWTGQSTDSMS